MPIKNDSTPPPKIGKIGPYTVFVTPPSTPAPKPPSQPISDSSKKSVSPPPVQLPPPVQAPPQQFSKSADMSSPSMFGLFWDAVAKVQSAHSSLDEYVANWFGLNKSKYQWALDDYYGNNGTAQVDAKTKDMSCKVQSV